MPKAPKPVKPLTKQARKFNDGLREAYLDPLVAGIQNQFARVSALNQAYAVLDEEVRRLQALPREGVPLDRIDAHLSEVQYYHKAQMHAAFRRALGVDIRPWLTEPDVQAWFVKTRVRNVDLIKTIPRRLHHNLRASMAKQFEDAPFDQAALRGLLNKEYKSAGWNLRRLTRDQTNKAIGNLTQIRHEQLQITRYTWISAGDNRVREEHQNYHGNTFAWRRAPQGGHPGEAILCRCTAEAIIDKRTLNRLQKKPPTDDYQPAFQTDDQFLDNKKKHKLQQAWHGDGAPKGSLRPHEFPDGIRDYQGSGYEHINNNLRAHAADPSVKLTPRTKRALKDFKDNLTDIDEGTVTFRCNLGLFDMAVGDDANPAAFLSNSADDQTAFGSFFGGTDDGVTNTIFEMRWGGKQQATVLNTYEFEYVAMPGTKIKVLARYDDIQVRAPGTFSTYDKGMKAKRYYILEVE